MFRDPDSEFVTDEVHDADREVMTFDAPGMALVWADGTRVSGWSADGNDLDSTRSAVAFRVLFGREAGQQRAYFTETLTGTICDITVFGPDQLSIAATDERPPQ